MSIKDIIESATPGPWYMDNPGDSSKYFVGNRADGRAHGLWAIVHASGDYACDVNVVAAEQMKADATYFATFDPEHVALMEAVIEASGEVSSLLTEHGTSIVQHLLDTDDNAGQMLRDSLDDLTRYRKERGLL